MAKREDTHRTASQRSDRSLEANTRKSRVGFWFVTVLLPAAILVVAFVLWSDTLGFDGPAVDEPPVGD